MKPVNPNIILLLLGYFLLFSVLPQDYGFLRKVISSIEKTSGNETLSDIAKADPCEDEESEDEEDTTPPTLVEEEDICLNEEPHPYIPSGNYLPYYLSNEDCSGIIPSIPIPPPDRA